MSSPAPEESQRVVVVGPDGSPLGTAEVSESGEPRGERGPAELVEQPGKVMRIGAMVKQLLEEVRSAPLDEAARERLKDVHASSVKELSDGLAPELREELERITLPFSDEATPSDAELRIAQAQLVGWLEGLFHGIQTALFAQQMAAKLQLEQSHGRAALGPGGAPAGAAMPGGLPGGGGPPQTGTGQYL